MSRCDICCPDVTLDDLATSLVDDDVLVFLVYKHVCICISVYLSLFCIYSIVYISCIEDNKEESFILLFVLEEYISRSRSSSITSCVTLLRCL